MPMISAFRKTVDAKANEAFLSTAVVAQPPQKLAAGLLQFIGLRRALAKECGGDFLEALPYLPREEYDALLEHLKDERVRAQLAEHALKKEHGSSAFSRSTSDLAPDLFALRVGVSIAILLLHAYEKPRTRASSIALIARLVNSARPHLAPALQEAKAHGAIDAGFGDTADRVLQALSELEPTDLQHPLRPAPAWLSGLTRPGVAPGPGDASTERSQLDRLKRLAVVTAVIGLATALLLGGISVAALAYDSHRKQELAANFQSALAAYAQEVVACADSQLADIAVDRLARKAVGDWQLRWEAAQAKKKSDGLPRCVAGQPPTGASPFWLDEVVRKSQHCYYEELPGYFLHRPYFLVPHGDTDPPTLQRTHADFFWQDRAVSEALEGCPAERPARMYLDERRQKDEDVLSSLVIKELNMTKRFQRAKASIEQEVARIEAPARRLIAEAQAKAEQSTEAEKANFRSENLKR